MIAHSGRARPPPLAALAVSVIAGLTGSASGGQGIVLSMVGPIYLAQGVSPKALHRVVAIASGSLGCQPAHRVEET